MKIENSKLGEILKDKLGRIPTMQDNVNAETDALYLIAALDDKVAELENRIKILEKK